MKLSYREAARTDLIRQFRYYLVIAGRADVAIRFREAVRTTAEAIKASPRMPPLHAPHPHLPGLRSWPVQGFRAVRVYFIADNESIQVLRILHGKQDVRQKLRRETL